MDISALVLQRVRAVYDELALPLPALLKDLPPRGWLPLADPLAWLRDASGQPLPVALRFHLGLRTLHQWYHDAAGFAICPSALDVLRHHVQVGSYAQTARGEGRGQFALAQLDEASGTAAVASSTPFCRDWERGLIQGALDAAGDLLYSDVRWDEAAGLFQLRFVSEANRERVRWAVDRAEEAKLWRLRNRVRQLEQHNAYLEARALLPSGPRELAPAALDWLDPVSGAATEAHLHERLQQLAAAPLPPRVCLLAYGLRDRPAPEELRQLGAAGLRLTRRADLLARLGEHALVLLLHDIEIGTARTVGLRMVEGLRAELGDRLRYAVLAWQGGSAETLLREARATLDRR